MKGPNSGNDFRCYSARCFLKLEGRLFTVIGLLPPREQKIEVATNHVVKVAPLSISIHSWSLLRDSRRAYASWLGSMPLTRLRRDGRGIQGDAKAAERAADGRFVPVAIRRITK